MRASQARRRPSRARGSPARKGGTDVSSSGSPPRAEQPVPGRQAVHLKGDRDVLELDGDPAPAMLADGCRAPTLQLSRSAAKTGVGGMSAAFYACVIESPSFRCSGFACAGAARIWLAPTDGDVRVSAWMRFSSTTGRSRGPLLGRASSPRSVRRAGPSAAACRRRRAGARPPARSCAAACGGPGDRPGVRAARRR